MCTGDPCINECKEDEFRCNDGHCLNDKLKCNGVPECKDGGDELGCSGWFYLYPIVAILLQYIDVVIVAIFTPIYKRLVVAIFTPI